jgi:hypothetical protein
MTAGSEVRGPMLRSSKAMALAPASRSGLPSPEPSRPARCPSPSVEGECCPYPAEHFAWGSAVLAAWRSCVVRGLLHRFGDAGCRPRPAARDPAERETATRCSMVTCSASCLALSHQDRSCLARRPCSPQYPCPLEQEAPFRSSCRADHCPASGSPFPAPECPAGSLFSAASRIAAWLLFPAPAPSSWWTWRWC